MNILRIAENVVVGLLLTGVGCVSFGASVGVGLEIAGFAILICACLISMWLFYHKELYSMMCVQVVFIILDLAGIYLRC